MRYSKCAHHDTYPLLTLIQYIHKNKAKEIVGMRCGHRCVAKRMDRVERKIPRCVTPPPLVRPPRFRTIDPIISVPNNWPHDMPMV